MKKLELLEEVEVLLDYTYGELTQKIPTKLYVSVIFIGGCERGHYHSYRLDAYRPAYYGSSKVIFDNIADFELEEMRTEFKTTRKV